MSFIITLTFIYLSDWLTTSVDFDLTDVEIACAFNLHDEISARRHAWGARQVYSGSVTHDTWILTTHVVVPQGRRCNRRRHVRQSDDEVICVLSWKRKWNNYAFKSIVRSKYIFKSNLLRLLSKIWTQIAIEPKTEYFRTFRCLLSRHFPVGCVVQR